MHAAKPSHTAPSGCRWTSSDGLLTVEVGATLSPKPQRTQAWCQLCGPGAVSTRPTGSTTREKRRKGEESKVCCSGTAPAVLPCHEPSSPVCWDFASRIGGSRLAGRGANMQLCLFPGGRDWKKQRFTVDTVVVVTDETAAPVRSDCDACLRGRAWSLEPVSRHPMLFHEDKVSRLSRSVRGSQH